MCGIGFIASVGDVHDDVFEGWNHRLSQSLADRGPDVPFQQCSFNNAALDGSISLHASVLHMRGQRPTAQPVSFPISSSSGGGGNETENCFLCWNGECYSYTNGVQSDLTGCETSGSARSGVMIELISEATIEEQSDTILVTKLLAEEITKSRRINSGTEHDAIAEAMCRIHGEYSFILHVPSSQNVYYGRDCLGRRSLLVNKSLHGVITVSSVATIEASDEKNECTGGWEEIRPGLVYKLDLCSGEETSLTIPKVINGDLPLPDLRTAEDQQHPDVSAPETLLKLLDRAVQRRCATPAKSRSTHDALVAVLFSGGIDSVVLAALSHRHVPLHQTIDLINVSFYNVDDVGSNGVPRSPDRLAAILSYHEMTTRFPGRKWRFIAVDVPYGEVLDHEKHILRLISPLDSTMVSWYS